MRRHPENTLPVKPRRHKPTDPTAGLQQPPGGLVKAPRHFRLLLVLKVFPEKVRDAERQGSVGRGGGGSAARTRAVTPGTPGFTITLRQPAVSVQNVDLVVVIQLVVGHGRATLPRRVRIVGEEPNK